MGAFAVRRADKTVVVRSMENVDILQRATVVIMIFACQVAVLRCLSLRLH